MEETTREGFTGEGTFDLSFKNSVSAGQRKQMKGSSMDRSGGTLCLDTVCLTSRSLRSLLGLPGSETGSQPPHFY